MRYGAQLLDKERVSRELRVLAAMRLQPQQLEVAMYARRRDRAFRSDRTHTPMRRAIDRFGVQRRTNQLGHTLVVDRARFARAQLITQSAESMRDEALSPLAHRRFAQMQARRNIAVGVTWPRRPTRYALGPPVQPESCAIVRSSSAAIARLGST